MNYNNNQTLNEGLLQTTYAQNQMRQPTYTIRQVPKPKSKNNVSCYVRWITLCLIGVLLLAFVTYLPLVNIYYAHSNESCLDELTVPLNLSFKNWMLMTSYSSLICLGLNLLQKAYDIYNMYYYSKYYKTIKHIFTCFVICNLILCFIWMVIGYILINDNKNTLNHCTKYLKNEIYSNEVVMIIYLFALVLFSLCCSLENRPNREMCEYMCV